MMTEHPIRTLTAREIECRVSMIRKGGLQLLLYKDARVDMAILDEVYGPMNWMRHHTRDNANCIISIWDDEKQQWIDKEDVGTESNTEAKKGLASDSFKRAGVNWGIGRELYTAPFIWITPPNCEIKEENGRLTCKDRFEVSEIGYNEHREIDRLVVINSKTHNVVFEMGAPAQKPARQPARTAKAETKQMATDEQIAYIREHADRADLEVFTQEFGSDLESLTAADAQRVIREIDRSRADQTPRCERCDAIITGVALPDGSTMTASELIGKSKTTYNGIYCFKCMKELNRKRKAG